MIKESIQKEDITIIYVPNIRAPRYIRQMLTAATKLKDAFSLEGKL